MRVEMPFTGRDDELTALDALLRTGRAGALVTGEPGTGKSRLASEAAALAKAAGVPVATVYGTRSLHDIPFGPFEARRTAEEAFGFAFGEPEPPLWEMAGVVAGQFMAAILDPQPVDGATASTGPIDPETSADSDPDDPLAGIWISMHGRELLARGEIDAAIAALRDGVTLLAANDPGRFRPWSLAALAAAHAMAGDERRAARAIAELDGVATVASSIFAADFAIGRAWAAHTSGDSASARSQLLTTFDQLAGTGSHGVAALVLLEAVRLGIRRDELADRAHCLPVLDCFVVTVVKTVADSRRDAVELRQLAHACADRNRPMWAAELAALAGAEAADDHAARRSFSLASGWMARCAGARTPLLQMLRSSSLLARMTSRESDVARLVATGLSNPDIAARLFVSRRTVESHLSRIYVKLGINSREELTTFMREA